MWVLTGDVDGKDARRNGLLLHIVTYRLVARQRPRNERVQTLLCNRRINKHPFLSNDR
jgi:hypothetical protein